MGSYDDCDLLITQYLAKNPATLLYKLIARIRPANVPRPSNSSSRPTVNASRMRTQEIYTNERGKVMMQYLWQRRQDPAQPTIQNKSLKNNWINEKKITVATRHSPNGLCRG